MRIKINGTSYELQSANRWWSLSYDSAVDIARFEVRPGDLIGSVGMERSEISAWPNVTRKGQVASAEFGVLIEPGALAGSRNVVLCQFHPLDAKGGSSSQQCLSLEIPGEGDRFRLIARNGAKLGMGAYNALWESPPLVRGREYAFRIEAVFHETNGQVCAWCEGKQITHFTGPCGYGDMVSSYFKAGIYRIASPEPLAVQFRRLRQV